MRLKDGRTDRQTDGILTDRPRLHSMQRGKKTNTKIIYALFSQLIVGFWGFVPRLPPGLHPWTLLETFVPRLQICPPLEKILRAPMARGSLHER